MPSEPSLKIRWTKHDAATQNRLLKMRLGDISEADWNLLKCLNLKWSKWMKAKLEAKRDAE